jgi:hypothetical protein
MMPAPIFNAALKEPHGQAFLSGDFSYFKAGVF